ncbi:MAG: methyltransferase domain-containing protein [Candidatus Omnitrophica bacterium]|nr:methyltransferase domain-containing protein [Candidatus Omnitrophota bacterium]
MASQTAQMAQWAGEFGRDYTDRNEISVEELEERFRSRLGWTRTELNERFIGGLDRAARILEVGCNIGIQLLCLQRMGFTNLCGIELQGDAARKAKTRSRGLRIVQGSALEIPFQAGSFDLVFTSGVLIHVSPSDLRRALLEIRRCSRGWIWGYEYFSDRYETVLYQGRKDLLWKGDFARLYRESFPDLKLLKEERYPYKEGDNVDAMFLLSKQEDPHG